MSAFPQSGRSDHEKIKKTKGCLRPEADVPCEHRFATDEGAANEVIRLADSSIGSSRNTVLPYHLNGSYQVKRRRLTRIFFMALIDDSCDKKVFACCAFRE